MLSLRAIARGAPRATTRLASFTSRPTFQSTVRQNALRIPQAAFSVSRPRFDAASQELAAKLAQEIDLEKKNNTPSVSDENVKHFIANNPDWQINDTPGTSEVTLTKKYDDEEITVAFSIVDFNTQMMDPEVTEEDDAMMDEEDAEIERGQSGGANSKGAINQGRTSEGNFKVAPEDNVAPADRDDLRDPEDDSQPAFPANLTVTIARPSNGVIRFNMVTDSGELTIHSLATYSNEAAANAVTGEESKLYSGPPFQQLDEEVQNLIEGYLDDRGINSALALFVPEYIDVKEQKEYLNWLGKVKSFVE
ncbi:regulatory protein-like protein suaprga1 [Polychaeton citri CBS 116435]|uniref:Regulatory protein-like protein suaprga1 n=1 Tax=Polychaeton citri CBS 116435 TaxID=1314669 RepID=A0A9P4UL65_9PEZI|nr:regulatory protein-like protein suaprga1 [Polychaeton citri CBS 116435]